MRCNLEWLKQWLPIAMDAETLGEGLTMASLELDAVEPVCHNLSKVVVGRVASSDICFADLKSMVANFLRTFFEDEDLAIRFRPSYFPFTEPSAEVDIKWREGKRQDWLEVMGCGMVHPAVFKAVGYDTARYKGYAFGMGIERLAMLRYCIDDLRLLFENNIRFLKQFNL